MIYSLKNNTNSLITLANVRDMTPNSWTVLYNSTTFEVLSDINVILSSCSILDADKTKNLNYCIDSGMMSFAIDGAIRPKEEFYTWLLKFNELYKYYVQYKAKGIVSVGIDLDNNKLVIGNRSLLVSDLPDNIDATKIASGIITNEEFNTLNNINTTTTIQAQLDSKQDKSESRILKYTQSIPSSIWYIHHNFGVSPITRVYDDSGEELLATITNLDLNTVAVKFSSAYTGSCLLIR